MGDEENHVGGEYESAAQTPLLVPLSSIYHEGCPGCMLDRRKTASQGTLPIKEVSLIALLALSNALPVSSLFSYMYFMVRDLGIAKSATQIGKYSGFLGSAMLLGRFLTSTPWGMVADRFGRIPVIAIGTANIVVFNTSFGFSSSYWVALFSRLLLGIGNGMQGTLTAYASEITRQEHQAVAMSVMGTMWGVGLIIGPAIGGYLAQPSEKLPAIFPSGSLFDQFPYALPSLCISAFALAGFVSSFFLLESVHKHGEESGKNVGIETNDIDGILPLVDHTTEVLNTQKLDEKRSLWRNWGLVATITVMSFCVLHATAYNEVFSLWAVSPETYGGLDFTTSEVADVLAVSGAAILIFQLVVFPLFANAVGPVRIICVSSVLSTILIATYPLFHRLHGKSLWAVLIIASAVKSILSACNFTGCYILINNSVEKAQRGVANGVFASFMAAFQAIGPTLAGAVFSWSEERMNVSFLPGMWMVFSLLGVLSFLPFLATFEPFLPPSLNNPIE